MAEPTPSPTPAPEVDIKTAPQPVPVPSPIIIRPRFMIRPYHKVDIEPMAKLLNTPNIARYMRNTFPNPYTLADAEFWVDLVTKPDSPHKSFGIFIPDPSSSSPESDTSTKEIKYKLAGSIGLQPHEDIESKTWNLGYLMGEAYQGQGIMTEAATVFTRWAFDHYPEEDLIRIEGGVFSGNSGSMKVLERIGCKFEGIRRKAIWKNGKNLDLHVYGLLREDIAS
ncbi:acyl-CoA N-acyltransferase [Naviculisporaceae sp. PSN 640]